MWWRKRHDRDRASQRAEARAEAAGRELERSRERLEETRANVVRPMRHRAEDNQFIELIRESLLAGHRQPHHNGG